VLYVYNVTATDADGNSLTFATPDLPGWLTFTVTGNGKARLQGVPTQPYVGSSLVTIKVSDGNNTTTQSFTIVVAEVNDAPVIKSTTVENATEGEPYSLTIEATDEENDLLSFSATLPSWLTLVDNKDGTALLTGTPTIVQVGEVKITILVSDGTLTTEQVIGLTVKSALKNISEPVTSEISLYPNPTQGKFTIDNAEGYKVLVFNSAGVVILQIENALVSQKIDLSNYGSGTYIVKIISKNNVIITKQIALIKSGCLDRRLQDKALLTSALGHPKLLIRKDEVSKNIARVLLL
jgi:VCBS repeat-containing protein